MIATPAMVAGEVHSEVPLSLDMVVEEPSMAVALVEALVEVHSVEAVPEEDFNK